MLGCQPAAQALARLFVGPGVPVVFFLPRFRIVATRAEQLQVFLHGGTAVQARHDVVEREALAGAALGQLGAGCPAPRRLHAGHFTGCFT